MSTRPKRVRKAPERYGVIALPDEDEEEVQIKVEEVEVVVPKRRAKRVKKEEPEYNSHGLEPYPAIHAPVAAPVLVASPAHEIYAPSPAFSGDLPEEPGPRKKITVTRVKAEYKLTEEDLYGLECTRSENPHGPRFAEMRLYKERDVYHVAIAKFGSPEGLMEAREKSKQRGDKAKATRMANQQRKREMEHRQSYVIQQLRQAGIPETYMNADQELSKYVQNNEGDLDVILARVAEVAAEDRRLQNVRKVHVGQRLTEMGLSASASNDLIFSSYVNFGAGLEQALVQYAAVVAQRQALQEREQELNIRLRAMGINAVNSLPPHHKFIFNNYLQTGVGIDTALAQFATLQAQEAIRAQRQQDILARLQAENLGAYMATSPSFCQYLLTGSPELLEAGVSFAKSMLLPHRRQKNIFGNNRNKNNNGVPNVCTIPGCNQHYSLQCLGKVCGTHKSQCSNPNCPKHKH